MSVRIRITEVPDFKTFFEFALIDDDKIVWRQQVQPEVESFFKFGWYLFTGRQTPRHAAQRLAKRMLAEYKRSGALPRTHLWSKEVA